MSEKNINEQDLESKEEQLNNEEVQEENSNEQAEESDEIIEEEEVLSDEERLKIELAEAKDKYLRLYSEFDNFRRRNAKERLELVKTASEDLIKDLLPILDDFERAEKSFTSTKENENVIEGFNIIKNKFEKTLTAKGLQAMESDAGIEFDPEIHEAITKIPAPDKKLKGKVVDVIEKGYMLNEKVVRYAKVIIGE